MSVDENKSDPKFSVRDWVELASRRRTQSKEKVVFGTRFGKVLRIGRQTWDRWFGRLGGVGFKKGEEIEVVSGAAGQSVQIPQWVREHLAPEKGDALCITARGQKYYLKKLRLTEKPSDVPGCVVIDRFSASCVDRTSWRNTDPSEISPALLRELLEAVGRFRRDPTTPFEAMDGLTGALARKEFFGRSSHSDRALLAGKRQAICAQQRPSGSWDDSAVATGYALIRLLELGATHRNAAVKRGVAWLLSCSEPVDRPGLFMFSEDLVQRYNRSRARTPGRVPHRFRQGGSPELSVFLANADLHGPPSGWCGTKMVPSTGVALMALLRWGCADQPRVIRAIHTLRQVPWCEGGIGSLPEAPVEDAVGRIDFSGDWRELSDESGKTDERWHTTRNNILSLAVGDGSDCVSIGGGRAMWVKRGIVLGTCGELVYRAMSYHPGWPGSEMERASALRVVVRQSWDGAWTGSFPSFALSTLERHRCAFGAFALLRSVPKLIRDQRADGLWSEPDDVEPIAPWYRDLLPGGFIPALCPETSSFLILRALKRFGFLEALMPR